MGDNDEPNGMLERLERLAYGAEEVRLNEEISSDITRVKAEIKLIEGIGRSKPDAVENLKDSICRYAAQNGYRSFIQDKSRTVRQLGNDRFAASQRILYLERAVSDMESFRKMELDSTIQVLQEKGYITL